MMRDKPHKRNTARRVASRHLFLRRASSAKGATSGVGTKQTRVESVMSFKGRWFEPTQLYHLSMI
jgi:hypothetical protein